MKKIFFILLLISTIFWSVNAQKKRAYITLDTSGSMSGEKFVYSNYTAQFISLLNEENDVYLIINGLPKKISGEANFYKRLQVNQVKMLSSWGISKLGTQIGDINAFNQIYEFIPNTWQYLYIIGDGEWDTFKYKKITDKFDEILATDALKVFFISYADDLMGPTDFMDYLKSTKKAKFLNSNLKARGVMNNTLKLLALTKGGKSKITALTQTSPKSVAVKTALPAVQLYILYQDEVDERNLPKLTAVNQAETVFKISNLGNPSTTNVYSGTPTLLSGSLWDVSGDKKIQPDNSTILTFDRNIKTKSLNVLAVYEPEPPLVVTINRTKSPTINQVKTKTKRVDTVPVVKQDSVKPKTRYVEEKNTYTTTNGLKHDSKNAYRVEVEYKQKIDTDSVKVEVKPDYPLLFQKVTAKAEGKIITLYIQTRGQWIDYFLPDTLKLKGSLVSKSKAGATTDSIADKFDINVVKTQDASHKSVWTIILLIPFILYLVALTRKARFKKGAIVEYDFEGKNYIVVLREKGLRHWLNRWLNPLLSEKREITFAEVSKTMTFYATRNRKNIMFERNQYNEEFMEYESFSPYEHKHMIFFEENAPLAIHNPSAGKITAYYDRVKAIMNDVPVFRVSVLVLGIILLILFVI